VTVTVMLEANKVGAPVLDSSLRVRVHTTSWGACPVSKHRIASPRTPPRTQAPLSCTTPMTSRLEAHCPL
jgi:hypothetical protein